MSIKVRGVFVLMSLLFSSFAWAEDKPCPYPEEYIKIDGAYHQCITGRVQKGASCELFIESIVKLFPKYNCKRSFDTEPVPAIWLFDAASENYIQLLYEMASKNNLIFQDHLFAKEVKKAKEIFLSQEFRGVLDGHLAEEYYPLIESVKNAH